MRVAFVSFFLAVGLVLPSLASPSASTRKETNAARFARGLPPLPPRSPSSVEGAARPKRSTVPPKTYVGRIEARYVPSGGSAGFLKNTNSSEALDGISFAPPYDLHVTFTVPQPGTVDGPFNILVTNPNFLAPYYVGASGGYLQTGSYFTASLRNVHESPLGAVNAYGEQSGLWYLEGDRLVPKYINPDGSFPLVKIAYDVRNGRIFFTGDIEAWEHALASHYASEVTFHIADIP